MKFLIAFVVIAVVGAVDVELDAMEKAADNVLARMHPFLGGEGDNSFSSYMSSGDFVRDAALQLNKTRRDRIEEGLGRKGVTFVSITRGKKQVNVTTVYGEGAGAVINLRDRRKGQVVDEPSVQEVDEITQPLYEKFVNDITEGDDKAAVVVRIGDEGRREFNLRSEKEDLQALARGGLRIGAKRTVSRRG